LRESGPVWIQGAAHLTEASSCKKSALELTVKFGNLKNIFEIDHGFYLAGSCPTPRNYKFTSFQQFACGKTLLR
jgi:hypothetical protein